MQGRVDNVGHEVSQSGKTRTLYAVVKVQLMWRKTLEDAEKELEAVTEELLGKDVLITVLAED